MTDTYKEANYVLHRFPMTILYNDVNQFTVEGFAKINRGENTEEKMIVKNLNILDFVIRFLTLLIKKDTIFNEKESNIAFDTRTNVFSARTRKPKNITTNGEKETGDFIIKLNYKNKTINFSINYDNDNNNDNNNITNINAIYEEIKTLFTDKELNKIDRNTITNNADELYKQDTIFHLLRLQMWAENKFGESVSFFTKTESASVTTNASTGKEDDNCGNNNTLMNNHLPIMLLTDSYKLGHPNMYPDNATKMVAYGEFRGPMKIDGKTVGDDRIVVCGLEYIIKNYIDRTWCQTDLDKAVKFFKQHAPGPSKYDFPVKEFNAIINNYNGKIPLTVEGLPDGTVVLPHTPVYKITAEEVDGINFSKLITFFETILTMVWYPSCVATLSRHCKQILENAYMATGLADKNYSKTGILTFSENAGNYKESILKIIDESLRIDETIQISMHDFGFRGATSVEQSVLGGMAHLLNFAGTDTMSAAYVAQQENGDKKKPVGFSIPATEHSVMTSFEKEKDAIKNMFVKYIKPESPYSIFAIVMDSYDYTRALFKELPNAIMEYNSGETTFTKEGLKLNHNKTDEIAEEQNVKEYTNYKVVLRPDSGDSIEVVLLGLVAACAIFGWNTYEVNGKNYIQCKNSGVIQGDGINVHKLEEILQTLTGTKKDNNNFLTEYKITSETDSQLESWFNEEEASGEASSEGAEASSGGADAAAPAAAAAAEEAKEEAKEGAAAADAPTTTIPQPITKNHVTKITHDKDNKQLKTPKYEITLEKYMEKIKLTNTGKGNGDGNGDSNVRITHALKDQVNNVLKKLGEGQYFTPDCMAFGMGGGLIQKVNRDTMKFATKLCSSTQMEGQTPKTVIVMKNPATDPGKRSIPGNMDVITVEANKNNNIPFQVVSLENLTGRDDIKEEGGISIKPEPEKEETKSKMTVKYINGNVEGIPENNFGEKRTRVNKGWNKLRTYIKEKKEPKFPEGRENYYDKTFKPHFSTKLNDMQQFYDPSQKKFVITKKEKKSDEANGKGAAEQTEKGNPKAEGNGNGATAENGNGTDEENGNNTVPGKRSPEEGNTAVQNEKGVQRQRLEVDQTSTSNSASTVDEQALPALPAPAEETRPGASAEEASQAGGSSSQSSSSLLNELNYELHLSMYVQKLLKMLIYRYLNHAGMELTYKEYMLEMFVNMVVFSVLNISNGEYFVCYLVDQMMIFIGMQIYLRIAQKENWKIDNNHLSAIILAPYYVALC